MINLKIEDVHFTNQRQRFFLALYRADKTHHPKDKQHQIADSQYNPS